MPKVAKELGPLDIRKKQHPDPSSDRPVLVPVGGVAGLYLRITPSGAKSWVLRTVIDGARRAAGLGSYPGVSLAAAREEAAKDKIEIWRGGDPIEQRKAARAKRDADKRERERRSLAFADAIRQYLSEKSGELTGRNMDRWQQTLSASDAGKKRGHVPSIILKKSVADISRADVLDVLQPIWSTKTETASKLRGRIENVLDWATIREYRTGDNPARWKGNLDAVLKAPGKIAKITHHPAVQIDDAPRWFAALRKRDGASARALEFVALTAVRSGDVRRMTWAEIDLDAAVWTIPSTRLKIKNNGNHRVPLAPQAVALLKRMHNQRDASTDYVFRAAKGGALSDMALSMLMRKMHAAQVKRDGKGWLDISSGEPAVPHGLRSTFKDWASARTSYPHAVSERALAHVIKDKVEQAYQRDDLFDKRRPLMRDWATFLYGSAS